MEEYSTRIQFYDGSEWNTLLPITHLNNVLNDDGESLTTILEPFQNKYGITQSDKNDLNLNNGIIAYPEGISYKIISNNDPSINNSPAGKRGTLTTHKVIWGGGSVGYNYQMYVEMETLDFYIRTPSSSTSWNDWKKLG